MIRRIGFFVASALLATLVRAESLLLPPAQYLVNGVDQGAPGVYPLLSGSGASVTLTGSPLASVQVTANGSPDFSLNSPTADLVYFFEFTSADGTPTPLPLLIGTTIFASFVEPPGGSGNDFPIANASLTIFEDDNSATIVQQGENVFGTDTQLFSGILSASILSDTLYRVDLSVHVNTLGTEQGSAYVDPQYFLDPGLIDPNGFSLLLSDGIGNASAAAPEPGTIGFVSLAAAGGLWFRRRLRG